MPFAQSFSRIFLIGHNFKDFIIQYGAGDDFSNAHGLDGDLTGIDEIGYARDTSYYEFDPVLTDTIIISVATTQIADTEKFLQQIIITNEIGTFNMFPDVKSFKIDPNEKKKKDVEGGQSISKNKELASLTIDMKHYPNQEDVELLQTLRKRHDAFLVWMNGGKPSQFRRELEGWRLRDIYLMQSVGAMSLNYYKNIYTCAQDQKLRLEEVSR